MGKRNMILLLLFVGAVAIIAACVSWPATEEPVTRGPGWVLLDATAVPTPTEHYLRFFSPMEVQVLATTTPPAEGWSAYSVLGTGNKVATVTAGGANCVTTNCWEWVIANDGYARTTYNIPTAEVISALGTPNGSMHLNFDIKMVETPTGSNTYREFLSSWVGTGADPYSLPSLNDDGLDFGIGTTPDAMTYKWKTVLGDFVWKAPNDTWQNIDVYADQRGNINTPEAGEIAYRVMVNGTPLPTPTGAPPALGIVSDYALVKWRMVYNATENYKVRIDNFLFETWHCGGGSACPTQTPTPTSTVTNTPRPTNTPGPTPSPTVTRTATPVPNWPTQNCPVVAVTVDGSLAEWSAVTPVALNSGAAAEVLLAQSVRPTWTPIPTATPATGPTATATTVPTVAPTWTPAPALADFDGLLYCAHSGDGTLYLAGTLTDSDINNPVGLLSNGDAAEITLDMLADGFRMPNIDDRVIAIAPNARVTNFATYPFDATTATGSAAGLWRFEIAIPATSHGRAGLDTGDSIGGTWGYYDNRGGATWAYRLMSAKHRLVLQ